MDYETINRLCYYLCVFSIVCGALVGIASIWFQDLWENEIGPKGFLTMMILLVASGLGAAVTKWLIVR